VSSLNLVYAAYVAAEEIPKHATIAIAIPTTAAVERATAIITPAASTHAWGVTTHSPEVGSHADVSQFVVDEFTLQTLGATPQPM